MPLGITDQQQTKKVADLLCKSNDSLQINKKTNTIKKKLFAFKFSKAIVPIFGLPPALSLSAAHSCHKYNGPIGRQSCSLAEKKKYNTLHFDRGKKVFHNAKYSLP